MRTASLPICASAAFSLLATSVAAQVVAPKVENVPIPAGVDVFNLDFDGAGQSMLRRDQRR